LVIVHDHKFHGHDAVVAGGSGFFLPAVDFGAANRFPGQPLRRGEEEQFGEILHGHISAGAGVARLLLQPGLVDAARRHDAHLRMSLPDAAGIASNATGAGWDTSIIRQSGRKIPTAARASSSETHSSTVSWAVAATCRTKCRESARPSTIINFFAIIFCG